MEKAKKQAQWCWTSRTKWWYCHSYVLTVLIIPNAWYDWNKAQQTITTITVIRLCCSTRWMYSPILCDRASRIEVFSCRDNRGKVFLWHALGDSNDDLCRKTLFQSFAVAVNGWGDLWAFFPSRHFDQWHLVAVDIGFTKQTARSPQEPMYVEVKSCLKQKQPWTRQWNWVGVSIVDKA